MTPNPFNTALAIVVAVIMALMVVYIVAPVIRDLGFVILVLGILFCVAAYWIQNEQIFIIGIGAVVLGLLLMVGANSYISTFESNPTAKIVLDAGTDLVNSSKDAIP